VKQTRVYGLDYLRILCMIFIVSLHYLGVGGAFYNLDNNININFTFNYFIASLYEAFSVVAVNCFIMISGYLLSSSIFKKEKLLSYILMVLFYSYGISLICYLIKPELINIKNIIYTILPISFSKYWFMTTYIVLYLLFPFINKLCNHLSQAEFKKLLTILVIIFSAWHTLNPFAETLDASKGYGIIWFILLYLLGAYIKKYGLKQYTRTSYFLIYLFLCSIMVAMKLSCNLLSIQYTFIAKAQNLFYHYNSLITLFAAIALFNYFLNLNIHNMPKILVKISSLTLGVYLIHDHFLFRNILWKDILPVSDFFNNTLFPLITIICIVLVFMICIGIEYLRTLLFKYIKLYGRA